MLDTSLLNETGINFARINCRMVRIVIKWPLATDGHFRNRHMATLFSLCYLLKFLDRSSPMITILAVLSALHKVTSTFRSVVTTAVAWIVVIVVEAICTAYADAC